MTITPLYTVGGNDLVFGLEAAVEFLRIKIGDLHGIVASAEARLDAIAAIDIDFGSIRGALGGFAGIAADIVLDFGVGLKAQGLINIQANIDAILDLVIKIEAMIADIEGVFSIGNVSAWTFDGNLAGYGRELESNTRGGFGFVDSTDDVSALILASASPEKWLALGGILFIGNNDVLNSPILPKTGAPTGRLTYHGSLPGPTLMVGLSAIFPLLFTLVVELQAEILELSVNLAAFGLVTLTIDPLSLGIGIGAAVAAFAGLQVGLPAASVQVGLDIGIEAALAFGLLFALEPIYLDLTAKLSGSEMVAWLYNGQARTLGREFASASATGIPGSSPLDRSLGLVLATNDIEDVGKLDAVMRFSA